MESTLKETQEFLGPYPRGRGAVEVGWGFF